MLTFSNIGRICMRKKMPGGYFLPKTLGRTVLMAVIASLEIILLLTKKVVFVAVTIAGTLSITAVAVPCTTLPGEIVAACRFARPVTKMVILS
jgi:hypothetical protein